MCVILSSEKCIKLNKRSARYAEILRARAVPKPDPVAEVAKTETDHHTKAESLRRTNEKIENIEKCLADDIGDEVNTRQRIAERQRVIEEHEQILLQEKESMKKDQGEMKKSKDQRRQNHSVELRQLVEEQRTGFEELKKSEGAMHAELTQRIDGYRMNDKPYGQSFLYERRGGADSVADELAPFDDLEDYDSDASELEPAMRLPPIQATDGGPTSASNARVLDGFFARKRPAEAPLEKAKKKVSKAAPRKPKARFTDLPSS
jgi:hypothetical protein